MKVSDYMQLHEQGLIPNPKDERDAGHLTIGAGGAIKGAIGTLGFGLSLPEFVYNSIKNYGNSEHPFLEAFVNATPNKYASKANNWIDEKLGIPEYEDMSFSQKAADFIGEAIPLIATGESYGLVKGSQLAAKKAALKSARNASKNLGKTTAEVLNDLKNTKNVIRPTSNFSQYIVPGYQVPTRGVLAQEFRKNGLVGKELQRAIRNAQLKSLGTQTGLDVGLREGLAALTDSQGLIGDYSIEDQKKNR